MKQTMKITLFEFMPYGAPELMEARPRHQARALMLACAAAIAVLGVTMGTLSLLPHRAVPVPTVDLSDVHVLTPQPLIPKPPSAVQPQVQPIPNVPAPPKVAVPVPVPDAQAPVVQPQPSAAPQGTQDVAPEPAASGTGDAIPDPNAYVYVEKLPEPIKQVKPEYSDMQKQAGAQGLVIVKALVGKDGHVMDVQLDPSKQNPLLNDAALKAARQWIFSPGMTNNEPVICWVSIPFHFQLH
jgi:TonB family protein